MVLRIGARTKVDFVCVAFLSLLGACQSSSDRAADSVGRATGSSIPAGQDSVSRLGDNWNNRGKADGTPCAFSTDPSQTRCLGYFGLDFSDQSKWPEIVKVLKDLDETGGTWKAWGGFVDRAPAVPGERASLRIRALKDREQVAFENLGAQSIVVARFEVKKGSGADARYGIRDDPGMLPYYYLVVRNYIATPGPDHNEGRSMADWQIYGIKSTNGKDYGALVPMKGIEAGYRFCKDKHHFPGTRGGAYFLTCTDHSWFNALIESWGSEERAVAFIDSVRAGLPRSKDGSVDPGKARFALDSALAVAAKSPAFKPGILAQGTLDAAARWLGGGNLTDPAWQHCGAGCCTVDDQ